MFKINFKAVSYIIILGIIGFSSCQQEEALTPNESATAPVNSNPTTGNSGGNTGGNQSTDRYIIADLNGTTLSLVSTGNLFNFSEPQFTRGYYMSCTSDCAGGTRSGFYKQQSGETLEIEFYQTHRTSPTDKQTVLNRIKVGAQSYKLNKFSGSTNDIDSVIVRYVDGNAKIWTTEISPVIAGSQSSSNFNISEVIFIDENSNLAFEYEKDSIFAVDFPSILVRGSFNCTVYDDDNNSIVIDNGTFNLRFDGD